MNYRALISVPIEAGSDDEALEQAYQHANTLLHPGGGGGIAGHVELLGEAPGLCAIKRVFVAEPELPAQLTTWMSEGCPSR